MRDIGKNIKYFRNAKALTQDELSEKLYVTRQTISNYENGKSQPDIEMLTKISEILDVNVSELINGPEKPHNKLYSDKSIFIGLSVVIALWLLQALISSFSFQNDKVAIRLCVISQIFLPHYLLFVVGWTALHCVFHFMNVRIP